MKKHVKLAIIKYAYSVQAKYLGEKFIVDGFFESIKFNNKIRQKMLQNITDDLNEILHINFDITDYELSLLSITKI